MGHFVYKYVYKGEIIYIGKNNTDLKSRLSTHGKNGDNIDKAIWEEINNSDIYYLEFDMAAIADAVETILISKYNPKGNKAKRGCDFGKYRIKYDEHEEDWKIFKKHIDPDNSKEKHVEAKLYNYLLKKYNSLKEEKSILSCKASVYEDYVRLFNKVNRYYDLLIVENNVHREQMIKRSNALNREIFNISSKEVNRIKDEFGEFFYDFPKERTFEEALINIRTIGRTLTPPVHQDEKAV